MTRLPATLRVAAALLLVGLASACSGGGGPAAVSPPPDYSGKTLQLAAVLSLTGAGAEIGGAQKQGIDLAVEVINRAGGVAGAKLAVEILDDASTPDAASLAFKKAINEDKVLGLVGPSLAISAAAAHPVASGLRTPVIATSLTGAEVVGSCAHACTGIYRDSLGDAAAVPDNIKSLARRAHPHSAVLVYASDDLNSTNTATLFRQALADNGITIAPDAVLQVAKAATSVTDTITAAITHKADAIVLSAPTALAGQLAHEALAQGYKGALVGGQSLGSASASSQAAGVQSAVPYFAGLDTAINRDYVAAFRARFKNADGKPLEPGVLATQAYTAVQLFAAAARTAGLGLVKPSADRAALELALGRTGVRSPMGLVGFTLDNDVSQPVYVVSADGKGGFTLVDTYPPR